MIYNILNSNNETINTIIADQEFMVTNYPDGNYHLVEEDPTPEVVEDKKNTRLAFFNRFSDEKAIAIDLASIGATVEAAAVRLYLKKVDSATFIDLNDPKTRAGVIALETMGLIGPGRALDILDLPVQPSERP